MSEKITVKIDGVPTFAEKGVPISKIVHSEEPCGGHGKCGKCKLIVTGNVSEPTADELALLSEEELLSGIRLGCLTYALGDCEVVTCVAPSSAVVLTSGELPEFSLEPTFSEYGVAIDIGTTTIASRLYDVSGGIVAEAVCLNPESRWGADVISRIEASLGGYSREIAVTVREEVDRLILELAELGGITSDKIDSVVITGNTVMLSLLTEECVFPLSRAPFVAERLFDETLLAKELELKSLNENTVIYRPPCISAFVGADVLCAVLASRIYERECSALVDLGTNGEMAIWKDGRLITASTAAGPAFEGVGISSGMRGGVGAIDKAYINDAGNIEVSVIGGREAVGICAGGLVDVAECMLRLSYIDETGYFEDESLELASGVSITAKDIRMLQLAKSAICAGLKSLCATVGVDESEVLSLSVAGGFGNYLNMESASKIGLLPKKLAKVSKTVGNAALTGASLLLLSIPERQAAKSLVKCAESLELSSSKIFSDFYISAMSFEEM